MRFPCPTPEAQAGPSRALGPWAGVPDLQHLQDEEDGADEAAFRIYAFVKDLKS